MPKYFPVVKVWYTKFSTTLIFLPTCRFAHILYFFLFFTVDVAASPPDSRAQDRSGTKTNDPQTQNYNYNHVTFDNIQDPPPHSGLNVRNQRIKKCTKRFQYDTSQERMYKTCQKHSKRIITPPLRRVRVPEHERKKRKEKQNTDTEKPLQSANETHHELITDHVWCSCNL